MKKFLLKLISFLCLLLLISFPIDFILSKQFNKETTDYRYAVWNDIIKGGMSHDILIMGSSRAWVQISPMIIDSVLHVSSYNIGIDGSKIDRQIPRLNLYLKRNNKPSVIIQNVDWGSTLLSETRRTGGYNVEQYYPYFYDNDMRQVVLPTEGFDVFDMYLPLMRYVRYSNICTCYEAIKNLTTPEWNVQKGYKGLDKVWDGSHLRNIDSLYFKYTQESLNEFCTYVKNCTENNIKMVFVYTPFYIDGTNKVSNIKEFYNVFDSVAKQYNVTVLDYLHDSVCYDTLNFYNAMHLNRNGAELFSRKLAKDLYDRGFAVK